MKVHVSRAVMAAVAVASLIIVLFVSTIVWAVSTVADRTELNCDRIGQLVDTLDTILASGDAQTDKYVQEGLLTPAQGRRADLYRERQRNVLRGADCPPSAM
jgi:hypothetical protein